MGRVVCVREGVAAKEKGAAMMKMRKGSDKEGCLWVVFFMYVEQPVILRRVGSSL